jgi:hypothetical protein
MEEVADVVAENVAGWGHPARIVHSIGRVRRISPNSHSQACLKILISNLHNPKYQHC